MESHANTVKHHVVVLSLTRELCRVEASDKVLHVNINGNITKHNYV